MTRLLDSGKTVLLETGGHRSLASVPPGVIKVIDLKCPGSGESAKTDWTNLSRLTARDQVKFVIADRVDYEYARDVVERERLAERCGTVLFSPVHGEMSLRPLAEWILADRLPVRLQLQMHKYIWDPQTRGV
jgi:7-carboxy-7-deazaguanine synthase